MSEEYPLQNEDLEIVNGEIVNHTTNAETLKTLSRTIQRDQARWAAEANAKRSKAELEAMAAKHGLSAEELRGFLAKNAHQAESARLRILDELAQQAVKSKDAQKWERTSGESMVQRGTVRYKPPEKLKEQKIFDDNSLNAVLDDLIQGL